MITVLGIEGLAGWLGALASVWNDAEAQRSILYSALATESDASLRGTEPAHADRREGPERMIGMSAIFGTPVAAVLLAVELLLFEFRARSIIPVALASATAAAIRFADVGPSPVFAMPEVHAVSGMALAFYIILGAVMGFVAVGVSRATYDVEDLFDALPLHWMWWPALGGLAVGIVGYFAPSTLGVGYDVIAQILSGALSVKILILLCVNEVCLLVDRSRQRDFRRHAGAFAHHWGRAWRSGWCVVD